MRTGDIPFRFDMSGLLNRARRQLTGRVGDVTLNLPFVSFAVSPRDKEKAVAREVVIRLKDRRVLSAAECCDNCIDNALASIQDIRRTLVDKQVELSDVQDGPLFLLLEAMAAGIRQFLTYEELLRRPSEVSHHPRFGEFRRPPDVQQAYFDALELLRGHLSRCLSQVALIAGVPLPEDGMFALYRGPWLIEAYNDPSLPPSGTHLEGD
jgi:hypothetical protein